jgi:hypothetical protein
MCTQVATMALTRMQYMIDRHAPTAPHRLLQGTKLSCALPCSLPELLDLAVRDVEREGGRWRRPRSAATASDRNSVVADTRQLHVRRSACAAHRTVVWLAATSPSSGSAASLPPCSLSAHRVERDVAQAAAVRHVVLVAVVRTALTVRARGRNGSAASHGTHAGD